MNKTTRHSLVAGALLFVPLAGLHAADMGRYDVVCTNTSKDASDVMPIGNGDIAAGAHAIANASNPVLAISVDHPILLLSDKPGKSTSTRLSVTPLNFRRMPGSSIPGSRSRMC